MLQKIGILCVIVILAADVLLLILRYMENRRK